ncbi:hypothetical protein BASA62_000559 [Batrachochytrium salamandrivorans]|nr:hypothetical protein BASA62_000559 [Batrachochytrium salamandrivorans]
MQLQISATVAIIIPTATFTLCRVGSLPDETLEFIDKQLGFGLALMLTLPTITTIGTTTIAITTTATIGTTAITTIVAVLMLASSVTASSVTATSMSSWSSLITTTRLALALTGIISGLLLVRLASNSNDRNRKNTRATFCCCGGCSDAAPCRSARPKSRSSRTHRRASSTAHSGSATTNATGAAAVMGVASDEQLQLRYQSHHQISPQSIAVAADENSDPTHVQSQSRDDLMDTDLSNHVHDITVTTTTSPSRIEPALNMGISDRRHRRNSSWIEGSSPSLNQDSSSTNPNDNGNLDHYYNNNNNSNNNNNNNNSGSSNSNNNNNNSNNSTTSNNSNINSSLVIPIPNTDSTESAPFLSVDLPVDDALTDTPVSDSGARGIAVQESKSLLQLLYSIAEDQARKEGYIHRSITCNHCGVSPVRGFRFKCANCVDFDICEICESLDVHVKTHVFIKIRIPIPPLANVRSSLFHPFYPGTEFISDQHHRDFSQLHRETHFDEIELEALYEQYRSLSTVDSAEGGVVKDTYFKCLGPLGFEKNLIAERIFAFFDQDRDGIINFKELVCGLSILCKGNLDERIHYAFQGYDLDGDGFVSRDELRRMFKAYFNMSMAIVRDVVKTMEEGMMDSFDDEAAKPVSASFSAPIQSSGGPESSSDNDEDDISNSGEHVETAREGADGVAVERVDGDDDGFGPLQNTVVTNGILRNRPRAAGPRRSKPRKVVEHYNVDPPSPSIPEEGLPILDMELQQQGQHQSVLLQKLPKDAIRDENSAQDEQVPTFSAGVDAHWPSLQDEATVDHHSSIATASLLVSHANGLDTNEELPITSQSHHQQQRIPAVDSDVSSTNKDNNNDDILADAVEVPNTNSDNSATSITPIANSFPVLTTSAAMRMPNGIMRRTSQPVLRSSLTPEEVNADPSPPSTRDSVMQIRQHTYHHRRPLSFDLQGGVVPTDASPDTLSPSTNHLLSPHSSTIPLPASLLAAPIAIATAVSNPIIPVSVSRVAAVVAASASFLSSADPSTASSIMPPPSGSPVFEPMSILSSAYITPHAISPSLSSHLIPSELSSTTTSTFGALHSRRQPSQLEPFPIMEAMSQDAIEEMVERTFDAVGASNRDLLSFDEFRFVVENDINMLAWFEALGSVF